MTHSMEPSGFLSDRVSPSTDWWWRLHGADGAELGPDPAAAEVTVAQRARFASQSDAESWIGESWRELQAAGVESVTLLEGDREVYGPMSLHT